jgi:hypothetical protein
VLATEPAVAPSTKSPGRQDPAARRGKAKMRLTCAN